MRKKYLLIIIATVVIVGFLTYFKISPQTSSTLVKIGYIVDETGPGSSYTQVQKRGISIAMDELQQAGRSDIKVIYEDSKLEPKLAVSAANKLITVDNVQVIFTLSSQETIAVAPVAERAKRVVIAPLPSSPELSGISKYFFRISPSDALQGKILASIAIKLGYQLAAVLYVNDVYGKSLADEFARNLKKQGGEVLLMEGYAPQTRDFRTALTKIVRAGPRALFLPVYPDDAIPIMRQLRELGIDVKVFGSDTFSNPSIFKNIPEAVQGAIFASPTKSDTPKFQKFSRAFQKKYGSQPDINAASAYDAVMIVAHITENMRSFMGESIQEALRNLKGYVGATGPIEFDENGDVIGKKFTIYVVKGVEYKPLEDRVEERK